MGSRSGPISRADLLVLREAVAVRTGVHLRVDNLGLLETRLYGFARVRGYEDIRALVGAVRSDPSGELAERVVEGLINRETSFFRDPLMFDELREWVLPELIERRRSIRQLRLWSAACSSGQEPYSLALLLIEHFPEIVRHWDVKIFATDVSRYTIARAALATYDPRELRRGLTPAQIERWFRPAEDDRQTLCATARRLVEFERLNLLEPWPRLPPFDLVLVRNLMIYWPLTLRRELGTRLAGAVRPDALVALGGAEALPRLGRFRAHVRRRWVFYRLEPLP